jgi:hypothetical protein
MRIDGIESLVPRYPGASDPGDLPAGMRDGVAAPPGAPGPGICADAAVVRRLAAG